MSLDVWLPPCFSGINRENALKAQASQELNNALIQLYGTADKADVEAHKQIAYWYSREAYLQHGAKTVFCSRSVVFLSATLNFQHHLFHNPLIFGAGLMLNYKNNEL